MDIYVEILGRRATALGSPVIVCDNTGYTLHLSYDAEWSDYDLKTVRFVYQRSGEMVYTDVLTSSDEVEIPVISDTKEVQVGVFAGDLRTSTPARIPCELSIRSGTGAPVAPSPSLWEQLLKEVRNLKGQVVYYVNLSVDANGKYTADKWVKDIMREYENTRPVMCRFPYDDGYLLFPLTNVSMETMPCFSGVSGGSWYDIMVTDHETLVTVTTIPLPDYS